MSAPRLGLCRAAILVALGATAALGGAPALAAATPVAHWMLESSAAPTNLPLQGEGRIDVVAANLGGVAVNGEEQQVRITDRLPVGLEVTGLEAGSIQSIEQKENGEFAESGLRCSLPPANPVVCTFGGRLGPYQQIRILIAVKVNVAAKTSPDNEVAVSGGEAGSASLRRAIAINGEPTSFGIESDTLTPENEDGTPDTQAGSHPYQLTSTFDLNQTLVRDDLDVEGKRQPATPALAKNLLFKLPQGLVGDPSAIPQCSDGDFSVVLEEHVNSCPNDTVVGVATVTYNEPHLLGLVNETVPIFNLVPSPGEPAAFGFIVQGVPVVLGTSIRTGEDYGVTVSSPYITQSTYTTSARTTFWGVPGAESHDDARGWDCISHGDTRYLAEHPCGASLGIEHPPAFDLLPTSCTGPLSTSMAAEAWNEADPGAALTSFFPGEAMVSLDGCERVPFAAEIKAAPDVQSASSPTGLTVDVHIPQELSLNANTPAVSDVKDTTVTLPEGVTVNPAGADELEACSEEQIGFAGFAELNPSAEPGVRTAQFTPDEPSCPNASKIATATIHTPLLPNPLEGAVYLAAQNANPFGSLIAQYLVVEDPVSGVLVKLPGEISLNQQTGQITSTFENTPELPFEELELHFFGGERAPLATPAHCGTYTTNATFTPWSGQEAVNSSSSLQITSGPNGGPCPGSTLPFTPELNSGQLNIQAGAFSPFTMTMSRQDGQQDLQSLVTKMPEGLSGLLSGVKLCPEAQADAGTCGPESEIGETIVSVGLGSQPYTVTGGRVYITEKYEGAPFGLSIVNPAKAGPFDLERDTSNPADEAPCDCVVTRAKIEVNPTSSALTVTTDPSGPYAIPNIIDGIPLEIKHVYVDIDRPGFMVNPTSCEKTAITGTLFGNEGASAAFSAPFQVTNCANLKFNPTIAVSTAGRASKADGAGLLFKITYPKGPLGSESWFNEAKFDLPKQLPARLTTLQQACLSGVFESDRAACPPASIIGHAVVRTQVLPVPLEGPVYFVSYGGAKFPEAVIFLQGYGVTLELHGETFISKQGITSATFRNQPDAPFESIEVNIPTGPYSEFGANLPAKDKYSFCGQKMTMPTFFKGSDGAEIQENTPVTVTGCKAAALTRQQKLAAALRACHKKHGKQRLACERKARKTYGPVKKASKSRKGAKRK